MPWRYCNMVKKVFVSGCYDLLHSGHVEFFRQAAEYGDLYVGIGSDETILHYKGHKTLYPENERLFMVKSIRYVKEAFINQGSGILDFVPTLDIVKPDMLVVNSDGASEEKRKLCEARGMEYVVLERTPHEGMEARSSTSLKATLGHSDGNGDGLPTRLDLAGTWIDQPYVSCYAPGWAITISLLPTFEIRERCGLSTSTRNQIKRIWPYQLPKMDPEMLARLVFCFENSPEREDGIISGAQDAIGICIPGLCRHYYDNHFWPERFERCNDEKVLAWLESHLCLIPMEPRKPGCNVTTGMDITKENVQRLAKAADECWKAILEMDLDRFARTYKASFEAQTTLFPAMIQGCVQSFIDKYSQLPGVRAWKMPGAGGGGYLALVVDDAKTFCQDHGEAIDIHIRRN